MSTSWFPEKFSYTVIILIAVKMEKNITGQNDAGKYRKQNNYATKNILIALTTSNQQNVFLCTDHLLAA